MLFDTRRPCGGTMKLVYFYRVEGRVFFHSDMAPDGSAFAFVEVPYKHPEESRLVGEYRLHVVR